MIAQRQNPAQFMRIGSIFFVVPIFLAALPKGETVHRGEVRFERSEDKLAIHASNHSIIHYENFDLSHNESIEFIQPNASSRVLNRIISATPTQIDGRLQANGHVYLLNPNGVLFGPQANIQVGHLFAGAAKMTDEDFFSKRDHFFDLQGRVVNQGLLQGDVIHLIGAEVQNFGRIETREERGYATMSSGETVLIGEKEGHCFVAVDPQSPAGIGASDFIGLAITNKGVISANEVCLEGNQLQVEGNIAAKKHVQILGDRIVLQSLQIDASGSASGGTVLIGGNGQEKPSLRQANTVWMKKDACIDVSATECGDGGRAVLWSTEKTLFDGQILARGGEFGGNGGTIETSSKLYIGSEKGRVDAQAPQGKAGDWLLDPLSITIATAGAGTLIQAADCADTTTNVTIANTVINNALANVLLYASTTIVQNADAPIHIGAAGVGITYQASISTDINSDVITNGGHIISNTGSTTVNGATLNSGSGNISLGDLWIGAGGATLQAGSGSLILSGSKTLANNLSFMDSEETNATHVVFISGIIDWVLRPEFWDTTPLAREVSSRQMLAKRIELTLEPFPGLRAKWQSIEKDGGTHSIELAISKYRSMKRLETGLINLSDFIRYLTTSLDHEEAKKTIATIQSLMNSTKQPGKNRLNSNPNFSPNAHSIKTPLLSPWPQTSEYLNQDLLEFTKPPSLSAEQWAALLSIRRQRNDKRLF